MPDNQLPVVAIPDAKKALHDRMAGDLLHDYKAWREAALADGGIDDMRRLVEAQIRVLGIEVDKKQDANAHLPVFNFVFHAPTGEMQATITMPKDDPPTLLQDVSEVQDVQARELPEPEESLDDMVAMLDNLLPVPKES